MADLRSVLWIELLGGMGDLVIALPAIHAVAQSYPNAHLTVLTFAPGDELLRTDPLIDRVVVAAKGEARSMVDRLLATQRFDLIVSDTNYDGIADAIQQYQKQQVPTPIAITNLWRSPPPDESVAQRFLDILQAAGVIEAGALEAARRPLGEIHLTVMEKATARQQLGSAFRPLIFLCPDAGMAIKRWPIDRFVSLGRILGQQYGATVIIPAGPDSTLAESIASQIAEGQDHATVKVWPFGNLRGLAAAIAAADLLIAGDTGLAHIAAALGIPTVTLFGPSWSERYGHPAPHVNLQGYPACPERIIQNFTQQSCWYSGQCPFDWATCLDAIDLETVLEAVDQISRSNGNGMVQNQVGDRLSIAPLQDLQLIHKSRLLPFKLFWPPKSPNSGGLPNHHPKFWNSIKFNKSSLNSLKTEGARAFQSPPELGDLGGQKDLHIQSSLQAGETSRTEWRSVRRLLVMRLDNIGDVIMTGPVLRAIKENLPQVELTLMASPAGSSVAPLLPWVDQVLPWRVLWQDLGKLPFDPAREWQLIETLKQGNFDAAIILTSFSQSPHPAGLVCKLAGISLRLGESKETDCQTLTHAIAPAPDSLHQVERNLRLIEAIGFSVRDRHLSLQLPANIPNSLQSPYFLLNPWTSCPSRNYPIDRFAAATYRLCQETGWPVVVTGVEKDRDRSQVLLQALGDRAIDLIGQTNLIELVSLVDQANLVLTNNTSVMHIADATQTPLVVLFAGTEQESQWTPRHTHSRLLRRYTVCSPCYAFTCSYQLQCLDIQPETVVTAALELLQRQGEPSCA